MRHFASLAFTLVVLFLVATAAHADEPVPAPARFRLELGGGPALSFDGWRVPARVGFAVRLPGRFAVVGEVGHFFGLEAPGVDDGENLTHLEHVGLGLRIWAQEGRWAAYVDQMGLWARYRTAYESGPGDSGRMLGLRTRIGLETPLAGPLSIGGTLGSFLALDVLHQAELEVGGDLYLAVRF